VRVLIHGINYAPEQIGIGKYTAEMAEWLAQRGHEVRMVTAPPYYPAWKVSKGHSSWQYQREHISGVDVWRCPLWVPAKPAAITRLMHLLSFTFSSFPMMLRQVVWRPDIVISIEPPLLCAPTAWITARLSGAKCWMHVQDFEIEAFFGLGFGSSVTLKRILTDLETCIMRRFDRVSTISQSMLNRLVSLHIPTKKAYLYPNWVDINLIRPNPEGRDMRTEWEFLPHHKIILYAGNIGKKQGLELILDAAEALSKTHPHAIFLLAGNGPVKEELIYAVKRRALSNIIFKPLQPLADLPAMLAMADIHLVIQKRGAADAVMPSKLTGILAAGGYSIITADADTELGRLVWNNPGIAELVEPENKDAFIKSIARMLDLTERFNRKARNFAVKHLAKDVILQDFERQLREIIGSS